jgi:hypothetical protein
MEKVTDLFEENKGVPFFLKSRAFALVILKMLKTVAALDESRTAGA